MVNAVFSDNIKDNVMLSHLQLKTRQLLSPSVFLKEDKTGNQYVIIEHPQVKAAFALHGAHLLHFQAKAQHPVIWISPTAIYRDQKAIRGGVPICWPWFGAASADLGEDLPSHGFARISKWYTGNISEKSTGVVLTLILNASSETKTRWPFDFKLTLKATLTDKLTLELITQNTGNVPFTYQGALHSYINISDVSNIKITGLNEKSSNNLTGEINIKADDLVIDQAIDSIYEKALGTIVLNDLGFKRQINIDNNGNDAEIVWNPWIDGAHACPDMPDDSYKTMLCIESAILSQKGKVLEAGSKHIVSTTLTAMTLNKSNSG